MKLRHLALGLALSLTAPSAFASYGDAGCGVGSMIVTQNSKLGQLGVFVINYLVGGITFSMTTGTSNCKVDGFVMNDKEIQYFAEANHEELTQQMAEGRGEKLAALASLYGCQAKQQDEFARTLQNSYAEIAPSYDTSSQELIKNISAKVSDSGLCQQI
ncbi:MAG: DUF3015 family protein [Pseudobdellovibrionaceae bacterium]|nr:DUF3015 family protein [Bdellovibrionales bacterium]USN46228.1 MAG: DUF3015 family protein [Pseudobdellovibrionaceae bacterium]